MAEILGVSMGAVSKWEIGHNMPDIELIMDMASLFDISVDVLLGHEMVAKRVDEIADDIKLLMGKHEFDEAENLSRSALMRYPNDFSILFWSALLYQSIALEHNNIDDAKKSIEFYERAKAVIAQNENPSINEFVIDSGIAANYMMFDNKQAEEIYKKINYGGAHNTMLSLVSLKNHDIKAALDYGTNGLIDHLSNVLNSSIYMIIALSLSSKAKDLDSAMELADTMIKTLDMFKAVPLGYYSKIEALFIILKAYISSCKGDAKLMKDYVRESKTLAQKYDEESSSTNISTDMKFFYLDEDIHGSMDSIGPSAVNGIGNLITGQLLTVADSRRKAVERLVKEWEKCAL